MLKRATDCLETALVYVSDVRDEEQDSLYNTPENLEGSERYEKMEEAVESLESAIEEIGNAIENIDSASS